MRIILAGMLVLSTVVTCIVMQIPDMGIRASLFILFGLVFGIPWAMKNISGLVGGLVVGAFIAVVTTATTMTISGTTGSEVIFKTSLGWIFPILAYTALGSVPLLGSDS